MPRISELPANITLTGAELIAIVQDGETRQVTLSAALLSRHPVHLDNAHWISSSYSPALVNDPDAILTLSSGGG